MNTLIDITSLHRIGKIITSKDQEKVRAVDVVALLHFAEAILFSNNIKYILFDNDEMQEKTDDYLKLLHHYDCIPKKDFITSDEPTFNDYYNYSYEAANYCSAQIESLLDDNFFNTQKFNKTIIDDASRPENSKILNIHQTLNKKQLPTNELSDFSKDLIKKYKVDGTFEAMVIGNLPLRNSLENLFRNDNYKLDLFFRNLLRLQTNKAIAREKSYKYLPAPQRAIFDNNVFNETIRLKLDKYILKLAKKEHDPIINRLNESGKIPLPSILISKLITENWQEPIGLMQKIIKLRDDNDIKLIRNKLIEIELLDNNLQDIEYSKLKERIEKNFKNPRSQKMKVFSLVQLIPDMILKYYNINDKGYSFEKILKILIEPFLKNKPETFITLIAKDLFHEKELGGLLVNRLKRIIVK